MSKWRKYYSKNEVLSCHLCLLVFDCLRIIENNNAGYQFVMMYLLWKWYGLFNLDMYGQCHRGEHGSKTTDSQNLPEVPQVLKVQMVLAFSGIR